MKLIDREKALSFPFANGNYDHEHADTHFIFGCEMYREWLEGLPVVEPERKTGRWIRKYDGYLLQCEFCNRVIREPFGYRFKFCPNCGADMREEK